MLLDMISVFLLNCTIVYMWASLDMCLFGKMKLKSTYIFD